MVAGLIRLVVLAVIVLAVVYLAYRYRMRVQELEHDKRMLRERIDYDEYIDEEQ